MWLLPRAPCRPSANPDDRPLFLTHLIGGSTSNGREREGSAESLVALLSRLSNREPLAEEPKIDRLRPGGTPHVTMPSDRRDKQS